MDGRRCASAPGAAQGTSGPGRDPRVPGTRFISPSGGIPRSCWRGPRAAPQGPPGSGPGGSSRKGARSTRVPQLRQWGYGPCWSRTNSMVLRHLGQGSSWLFGYCGITIGLHVVGWLLWSGAPGQCSTRMGRGLLPRQQSRGRPGVIRSGSGSLASRVPAAWRRCPPGWMVRAFTWTWSVYGELKRPAWTGRNGAFRTGTWCWRPVVVGASPDAEGQGRRHQPGCSRDSEIMTMIAVPRPWMVSGNAFRCSTIRPETLCSPGTQRPAHTAWGTRTPAHWFQPNASVSRPGHGRLT